MNQFSDQPIYTTDQLHVTNALCCRWSESTDTNHRACSYIHPFFPIKITLTQRSSEPCSGQYLCTCRRPAGRRVSGLTLHLVAWRFRSSERNISQRRPRVWQPGAEEEPRNTAFAFVVLLRVRVFFFAVLSLLCLPPLACWLCFPGFAFPSQSCPEKKRIF